MRVVRDGGRGRRRKHEAARSSSACSWATVAAKQLVAGREPIVPMNGAPGIRTPGTIVEVAQPAAMSQLTLNGSGKTSTKESDPGTWVAEP